MKFKVFGSGTNNIIFLHGWGADRKSFSWLSEYLKNQTLHFASLDGFDGTLAPEKYTIADYADRLRDYVLQNNLDNVIIVGHSFGGRIAIEYASKFKLKALVLVDSAGLKPKPSLKKYYKKLKFKIAKQLVKLKLLNPKCLQKFGSTDYKNCSAELKKVFISAINYFQDDILNLIKTETLIIWGEKDTDTPLYMAQRLNKGIKNSALVVLEDSGHFCFLDKPYQFYKILESFVTKV